MFPAIAMKLLDFVALYGLVLMPMGAVVFVDFWLRRRLGFEPEYAERSGSASTGPRRVAWLATLAVCLGLAAAAGTLQIYFVGLPGWFVAALLYVGLSRLRQARGAPALARSAEAASMKPLLKLVSALALVGTIAPPVLFLLGRVDLDATKLWMALSALAWFAATPFWMEQEKGA